MKKDRTIQYRGWNVEYSGRDHWDSFGLVGYLIFEFDIEEDSLSFGDLDNEIVKRLFGKLFGRYYVKLKHYIEHRQEEAPRSWVNFEKLAKKWINEEKN